MRKNIPSFYGKLNSLPLKYNHLSFKKENKWLNSFHCSFLQKRTLFTIPNQKIEKLNKCPIFKIALTGGPCAGKSSALQYLKDYLTEKNFKVLTVPEAATIMFGNGAEWDTLSDPARYTSIKITMQMQMALEDKFVAIAENIGRPSVILCDRGVLDNEAYCPDPMFWDMILHENEWNLPQLRERRYDQIIHLVTTAIGAREFYSKATNVVRRETAEQAAELDRKILDGYIGHPRVAIVDNKTGFEEKVQRAIHYIEDLLHIPRSLNNVVHRRYLIKRKKPEDFTTLQQKSKEQNRINIINHDNHFKLFDFPSNDRYSDVTVKKTFLKPKETISSNDKPFTHYPYIARIGEFGIYQYFYRPENCLKDLLISASDYIGLLEEADPQRKTITKRLRYFVHENIYYNLCDINDGESQFINVSLDHLLDKNFELPSFISELQGNEIELEFLTQSQIDTLYNDLVVSQKI